MKLQGNLRIKLEIFRKILGKNFEEILGQYYQQKLKWLTVLLGFTSSTLGAEILFGFCGVGGIL